MKMIKILLFVMVFASSCVSKKSADKIIDEKNNLEFELRMKDSVINEIFVSLSTVVENLSDIKTRENIISKNISNGEIPKQYTTIISEDILAIDNLLQDNRATINSLKANLDRLLANNIRIEGLEQLSNQLAEQVEHRNEKIDALKQEISTMNIKVDKLSVEIKQIEASYENLSTVNAGLSGELKTQEDLLNTCYYMIGSEKELISRKIVYKSGFIGRTLKVNENHSLDAYTKINMSEIDNIYVGHKKIELVTVHPVGSYSMRMASGGLVEMIEILDRDLFWSASKILIVSYK